MKIGILLSNLGTPEAPTVKAVRRYLAEFLSDRHVIELSPWLWLPILHGIILRTRPRRSAHAYQSIWTPEGSPLLAITQKQAQALQKKLGNDYVVTVGMRYGRPSIAEALKTLKEAQVSSITVLPLYPQFSKTTTQSTIHKITTEFQSTLPLKFIEHYYNHPWYIQALANAIETHWETHGKADLLLFSFHGLPQAYVDRGDPYYDHCIKTTQLLTLKLKLEPSEYRVTFQSRLGKQKWLKPYTDQTLKKLPEENISSVQVFCPGFSADCLETLEEINVQNRAFFMNAGGLRFEYIPALNDHEDHIRLMIKLIQENTHEQHCTYQIE